MLIFQTPQFVEAYFVLFANLFLPVLIVSVILGGQGL